MEVEVKQAEATYSEPNFQPVIAFCRERLSSQAFAGEFQSAAQGLLQFAVTADEDSESDSRVKTMPCGELCEISDDMERPRPRTAEKSSAVNPPVLKSCPTLGKAINLP